MERRMKEGRVAGREEMSKAIASKTESVGHQGVAKWRQSASKKLGVLEGQWAMLNLRALICACGLLVAVLAFRVFYIQELFFAFLFFAILFLLLLLMAAAGFSVLSVYAQGITYFSGPITAQGHTAF